MIRDTSREAYEAVLPDLSEKQATVLGLLNTAREALTNSEIGQALAWPINTVTPRTNELVKLGKVADAGKRTCRITGRTAHTWGVAKTTLF